MFKRFFIILLLLNSALNALSIRLNNGKESGNSYYIVQLENERPFKCQVKIGDEFYPPDTRHLGAKSNKDREYHCFIEGKLTDNIADQHLPFMDLYIRPAQGGFNVIIAPKILSRLVAIEDHLYHSMDTEQKGEERSRHYTIVIDERTSIALAKSRPELDFPIIFPSLVLPNIGALDFNKDPLITQREGDIAEYITIKNLYSQEKYEDVIDYCDQALKRYPSSVFYSEFQLYLVRALYKANQVQKAQTTTGTDYNPRLLEQARSWVRNFASDKNYAEVLFMLMQAYLDDDNSGDANYILDLLMTEHENSPWTKQALVAFADNMSLGDKLFDAMRIYEDVLYMTDEVGTASLAAMKLASASLRLNRDAQAVDYINKVLEANEKYIGEHRNESLALANQFRARELNDTANKLYKLVMDASAKKDEQYEIALRHLALSPANESNADEIYDYLRMYENEFKNSEYLSLITTAIDKMFFNIDTNQTSNALHATYDDLMERHAGSDIGHRALKEKIKLYLKEGAYKQILSFKNEIMDNNDSENHRILGDAASALANEQNQKGQCDMLMLLIDNYAIEPKVKDKYKLFNCYMRQARFDEALALTKDGVESPDLHTRIEWLSNASQALYSLGRFEEALKAADDAIFQAPRIAYADPSRAIYYRFYSLLRLNRLEEALSSIELMSKQRGAHFMLIELYDAAAKYAAARALDTAALSYAQKTIEMQKQLKINTYSPEIDFIYIDTLKRLNDDNAALESLRKLITLSLGDDERSRALYSMAELEMKKGFIASAKEHVKECLDLEKNTPWKALCREQNALLND